MCIPSSLLCPELGCGVTPLGRRPSGMGSSRLLPLSAHLVCQSQRPVLSEPVTAGRRSTSVRSIKFLSFIEPIFVWNVPLVSLIFWRDLSSFLFYSFPLFLCIDHWGGLSYLFLLFFGTLHSYGYIFPFLLCFLLLFFSQLFVRPPQTAILLFCFSFSWGYLAPCLLYNVTNLCP